MGDPAELTQQALALYSSAVEEWGDHREGQLAEAYQLATQAVASLSTGYFEYVRPLVFRNAIQLARVMGDKEEEARFVFLAAGGIVDAEAPAQMDSSLASLR
jgi:hypothetical protein